MKRYILILACMLVASGIAAQKTMVVHKKDGTKVGINMDGILSVSHFGKSTPADDDYVQILSFTGDKDAHYITIKKDETLKNIEEYGVVWSNLAGVTFDGNGTLALSHNENVYYISSEPKLFTPYYYRAYIKKAGNYYYSSEQSHTFLPFLRDEVGYYPGYGYAEGYAIPTEDAFTKVAESYGAEANETIISQLKECWKQWATPKIIAAINKNDAQKVQCEDGTLYKLSTVPENFVTEALGDEGTFNVEIDYFNADYSDRIGVVDTIYCDKSLGLKDNRYLVFQPTTSSMNLSIGFNMPRNLPGYVQEVYVVFAPETRDGVTPLGTSVRGTWVERLNNDRTIRLTEANTNSSNPTVENAEKTDTLVFTYDGCKDFSTDVFKIEGRVSNTQVYKGLYTRQLRISEIYVKRRKAAL